MSRLDFIKFKQFGKLNMGSVEDPYDVASIPITYGDDRIGEAFLVGYRKSTETSEPEFKLSLEELMQAIGGSAAVIDVQADANRVDGLQNAAARVENIGTNKFKFIFDIPSGNDGKNLVVRGDGETWYAIADTPEDFNNEASLTWKRIADLELESNHGKYVMTKTEVPTSDTEHPVVVKALSYLGYDSAAAFADGTMTSVDKIDAYEDLAEFSYENAYPEGSVVDKPTSASTYPYIRFEWTFSDGSTLSHKVIYVALSEVMTALSITTHYGTSTDGTLPTVWNNLPPTDINPGTWLFTKIDVNGNVSYAKSYIAEDGQDGAAASRGAGWHVVTGSDFESKNDVVNENLNTSNTIIGDLALNDNTGNVFQCAEFVNNIAVWHYVTNIIGEAGPRGYDGTRIYCEGGSNPSGSRIGDLWINLNSGYLMKKTEEGVSGWHNQFSMKGAKGDTGVSVTGVERNTTLDDDQGNKGYSMTLSNGSTANFLVPTVKGDDGADSEVTLAEITGGVTITSGSQSVTVYDGTDGVSPTVSISPETGATTVVITDKNGPHSFTVNDGQAGQTGATGATGQQGPAGPAPVVASSTITGGHRITFTSGGEQTVVDVMDGQRGYDGTAFVDVQINVLNIQWVDGGVTGSGAYYKADISESLGATASQYFADYISNQQGKKIDFMYSDTASNVAKYMRMGLWFGVYDNKPYLYCLDNNIENSVSIVLRFYTNLPD